jgi:hypothetical protein
VLRGAVIAAAQEPVADAEVMFSNVERVLADERGEFALPLRFTALNVSVVIDALHQRTGRHGSISVSLPAALRTSQTIAIA